LIVSVLRISIAMRSASTWRPEPVFHRLPRVRALLAHDEGLAHQLLARNAARARERMRRRGDDHVGMGRERQCDDLSLGRRPHHDREIGEVLRDVREQAFAVVHREVQRDAGWRPANSTSIRGKK
jgi:hypothetical protein